MKDLKDQKFGKWTVLEPMPNKTWLCECECGTKRNVLEKSLLRNKSKSCGCVRKLPNLIGQKFGEWEVIDIGPQYKKNTTWLCRCCCGKEELKLGTKLVNGRTKSCGCQTANFFRESTLSARKHYVGKTFGHYTIIDIFYQENTDKSNRIFVECQCDCGNKKNYLLDLVVSGEVKSCGCKTSELLGLKRKHEPSFASALDSYRRYHDGDLDLDTYLLLVKQNCHYCKAPPNKKVNVFLRAQSASQYAKDNGEFICNGLDRLDSSKKHDKDNVVPCCWPCNKAKSNMTSEEFKIYVKTVSAHHLYEMTPEQLDEAVAEWKTKNEKAPSLSLGASSELSVNQAD